VCRMFKTTIQIESLKEIVDISGSVVKQAKISFTKEGINLIAAESSRIAMAQIKFSDKVYKDFQGDGAVINVDLEQLRKTLGLGKANQSVVLSYEEKDNRLVLVFGDITRQMLLLSELESPTKMPNVTLESLIICAPSEILQGIKATQLVESDEIEITMSPSTGFKMHAENKSNTFDIKIPKERLAKYDVKEETTTLYPLKMFASLMNNLNGVEQVTMRIGKEKPMRLDFDLSAGIGKGMFLVAPKITEVD
jgi:proliferating cell nuclear antigen